MRTNILETTLQSMVKIIGVGQVGGEGGYMGIVWTHEEMATLQRRITKNTWTRLRSTLNGAGFASIQGYIAWTTHRPNFALFWIVCDARHPERRTIFSSIRIHSYIFWLAIDDVRWQSVTTGAGHTHTLDVNHLPTSGNSTKNSVAPKSLFFTAFRISL